MPLNDYLSECKKNQKIIVSKDKRNPQKHIALNNDLNDVYHYKIDGGVITFGLRCDYLLWNETKHHIYFIELKGSDIKHALDQIEETDNYLKIHFPLEMGLVKNKSYRIVLNRVSPIRLYSQREKQFKNKHLGDLKYDSGVIKECI